MTERAPTQPSAPCTSFTKRRLQTAVLFFALLSLLLLPAPAVAQDTSIYLPLVAQPAAMAELLSPDGRIAVGLRLSAASERVGVLLYDVRYDGAPLLGSARLGLTIPETGLGYASEFEWVGASRRKVNESYTLRIAERSTIPNVYNELTVTLKQRGSTPALLVQIVVRAYDEGVALRYALPAQEGLAGVTIAAEHTRFSLQHSQTVWQQPSPEAPYDERPAVNVALGTQGELLTIETPLTLQNAGGAVLSLAEAAVENAPRMRLRRVSASAPVLVTMLDSPIVAALPYATPWRVVMIAPNAAKLYEQSYLMYNLAAPSRLQDESWLRPGTALRVMTLDKANARAAIDFARAQGIEYIEFDAGWYSQYDQENNPGARAWEPIPALGSIESIVEYGVGTDTLPRVGLILYVNYAALRTQMDDLMPRYQGWGVSGIKVGFVDPRTQAEINFMNLTVREAADRQMFVDIHDDYVPSGLTRTLPNLFTQEGVRGSEHFPGAAHDTLLPFTRFQIGAADYTIPYFGSDKVVLNTSRAHQLALAVVFYSPLKFVFWYDFPWKEEQTPDVSFFGRVPTTWDETVVLHGEIGDFAAVARRKGDQWFVGSITDENARTLDLALDFLPAGRTYRAQILRDGDDLKEVIVETMDVTRDTIITAEMQPSGGHAMWLEPAD